MANETRRRRPSVSFDAPPFQKDGLHLAHPGISIKQAAGGRAVLCDCHCGPMYCFPVFPRAQGRLCNVLGIRVWALLSQVIGIF